MRRWLWVPIALLSTAYPAAQAAPAVDPVYITAGEQWKPVEHTLDIEAKSILDFSSLLDAPAGKHGPVVVRGSHFEFEGRPGQRVRFYGANTCFSANFPDKAQAEQIAERIARIGYNCIRIHHYDGSLVDRKAGDSVTLDAGQLDKLDYFVACLKKRGIYINIDLFTIRGTRAHEIPELSSPPGMDGYKALVPLLDSAMKNWQAFARNLMTHRNPYTGLTWAEDPVLVGICPLNEDPLSITYKSVPEVRKLYQQRFEEWLKAKNLSPKDDSERNAALSRFLTELQIKANQTTFAFLKSLGVKAPLTSVNCLDAMALTPVRAAEEYVDNHAYWDHPNFPERPWSLPHRYGNKSATGSGAQVPRTMLPTRVIGKPFTCTEINYCFPNRFRAEGGVLMGAYAALQDWDGLYRFAYSHSIGNLIRPSAASGFDLATDPLSLLSERIGMLMFLRGDVAPARKVIPFLVSDETVHIAPPGWGQGSFPEQYQYLGLHTGIGSLHVADEPLSLHAYPVVCGSPQLNAGMYKDVRFIPADKSLVVGLTTNNIIPADAIDMARRRVSSDTGQIQLAADQGTLRVVTDRTECFVLKNKAELQGHATGVCNEGEFAVVCISSMDGKPIAESARLLVLHLTDLQNTRTRYRDQSLTMLEQWGQLPHLLRSGKVQVRLKLSGDRPLKAWSVDLSGRRREVVEVTAGGNGGFAFTADTGRGYMAYELLRE